jgi:hypothetical protein
MAIYDDKNDLFKIQEKKNIIKDIFTQPLIVAFSGFVNEEVKRKAKSVGFNLVIEAPLDVPKIREIIIPCITQRRANE